MTKSNRKQQEKIVRSIALLFGLDPKGTIPVEFFIARERDVYSTREGIGDFVGAAVRLVEIISFGWVFGKTTQETAEMSNIDIGEFTRIYNFFGLDGIEIDDAEFGVARMFLSFCMSNGDIVRARMLMRDMLYSLMDFERLLTESTGKAIENVEEEFRGTSVNQQRFMFEFGVETVFKKVIPTMEEIDLIEELSGKVNSLIASDMYHESEFQYAIKLNVLLGMFTGFVNKFGIDFDLPSYMKGVEQRSELDSILSDSANEFLRNISSSLTSAGGEPDA